MKQKAALMFRVRLKWFMGNGLHAYATSSCSLNAPSVMLPSAYQDLTNVFKHILHTHSWLCLWGEQFSAQRCSHLWTGKPGQQKTFGLNFHHWTQRHDMYVLLNDLDSCSVTALGAGYPVHMLSHIDVGKTSPSFRVTFGRIKLSLTSLLRFSLKAKEVL